MGGVCVGGGVEAAVLHGGEDGEVGGFGCWWGGEGELGAVVRESVVVWVVE